MREPLNPEAAPHVPVFQAEIIESLTKSGFLTIGYHFRTTGETGFSYVDDRVPFPAQSLASAFQGGVT
jgi:hypothetical protein